MTATALLTHPEAESVFAYRHGQAVSRARFLGDVARLAEAMPARRYVINLCRDRYLFTAGFAAALCRQQTSLLPPSDAQIMLREIAEAYRDVYALADHDPTSLPCAVMRITGDDGHDENASVPSIPNDQPAVILFTSGSTGRPKPHVKSWGSLVRCTRDGGLRLGMDELTGAALLGTVPAQHSYGLESTVLLCLQHGLSLYAGRPFYPADISAALATLPRPRILVTTPIHLRALLQDGMALPPADLILSATAPLAPQLAVQAEARFSCPLLEIYGCTEAGQIAARRPAQTPEWRCLGDMRLRQTSEATVVFGGPLADEVPLGDVIEILDGERFRLLGRSADLVNIAGKRSSLTYLNFHLNAVEGVKDGIFVMPESRDGAPARLMAFVVAPGLTAEDVLAALRQRVDPAFLPRPLLLVDALPRNAVGKLPREQIDRLVSSAHVR